MRTRLSRRRFLQLLGAASAGVIVPGCADSSGGNKQSGSLDRVIVIGAGMAGLTVANALTTAGVETIVLEARDRLGGRTWTADIGGMHADLGGSWIHGPDGNPVACFAAANGIGWTQAESIDVTLSAFDPHNGFISGQNLLRFLEVQTAFEGEIASLRATLGPRASLSDGVTLFLDQMGFMGDDRRYADFALRQGIGELFYAGPSALTSLDALFDRPGLSGGNHFPDGGYVGIVNAMASGVDVRLNQRVQRVEHDGRGVVITTQDGKLRGSHAVVTVPLGVLKAGLLEFEPGLPAAKTGAIAALDMGNLEKVVFRFERNFWREARRRNLVYLSDTYGEFPFFFDYTPFGGSPALIGFYCGSFARAQAARTDEEVRERVLAIFTEVFGADIGAPTHFARTRWTTDPLAGGSYSYVPVGGSLSDMDILGEPASERLLFAGEATVPAYYGTVHAAFISGVREAKRLLQAETIQLLSGPAPEIGCASADPVLSYEF